MKHTNKKGFTIVELVIVIAVIAILAAVLIPNLSRLVSKANESSAMQAARNEYEAYLAEYAKDLDGTENFVIVVNGEYAFEVEKGQFKETALDKNTAHSGNVDLTANVVKSAKATSTSAPNVTDTDVGSTWYTDAACKTVATSYTEGTVYYYAVAMTDLGSADVAIYAK